MQMSLESIFNGYMAQRTLFRNRKAATSTYKPADVLHRDAEVRAIATILSPSLKNNKPSNLFIYGKPGTGKTTVMQHVMRGLERLAATNNVALKVIYLNCKMKKAADTEYRIIAQLSKEFGRDVPPTGLPTVQIYDTFFEAVDSEKRIVILVLDEIDVLVSKIGDSFLYNLTRMNEELENAQIALVGISNNLSFTTSLDPRVKSSLSEEEVLFAPYNALQLRDILHMRSGDIFTEGVLEDGVIEKCAALAAQEHGDARRAIDLLRVAAELAEREGSGRVAVRHVDLAEGKIDADRILETIRTQPRQSQAVLWTIMKNGETNTGNVYSVYESVCKTNGLKPLTQRRVSDLISELDALGIIETRVISKGRYGRTRTIRFALTDGLASAVESILKNEYYFQ